MKKFKKGAASFYIVAFSTLILMIVAMSFAAVIISEVTRTSNDDLSQSAYDSALAGVEDAKLAFYKYQSCKAAEPNITPAADNGDGDLTCAEIVSYVEESGSCDMVAKILGRDTGDDVGVAVEEGAGNNMAQFYTCVKFSDTLGDYRSTLSASNLIKVMRAKFDNGVHAKDIARVRVSWYSEVDQTFNYNNYNSSVGVYYPRLGATRPATPPTISIAGLQTAGGFTLSDFEITRGNTTDKWMVYLTPVDSQTAAAAGKDGNFNKTSYSNGVSQIGVDALLKSNDKTRENLPYGVYCNPDAEGEFACSVEITLPGVVNGGDRNDDTFVFVVGLPYGNPSTDFSLEFFCANGAQCGEDAAERDETMASDGGSRRATLKGVQVQVDSTGKANDLFRRVETRLEDTNDFALSIMGPLELFGETNDGSGSGNYALKKDYTVVCEYNFGGPTC